MDGKKRMEFKRGDLVIYAMSKRSPHPGPHARDIRPSSQGEDYGYVVDKFWVVESTTPDGYVMLGTRRGKHQFVKIGDRGLRRARWWERLLYRHRFPKLPNRLPEED